MGSPTPSNGKENTIDLPPCTSVGCTDGVTVNRQGGANFQGNSGMMVGGGQMSAKEVAEYNAAMARAREMAAAQRANMGPQYGQGGPQRPRAHTTHPAHQGAMSPAMAPGAGDMSGVPSGPQGGQMVNTRDGRSQSAPMHPSQLGAVPEGQTMPYSPHHQAGQPTNPMISGPNATSLDDLPECTPNACGPNAAGTRLQAFNRPQAGGFAQGGMNFQNAPANARPNQAAGNWQNPAANEQAGRQFGLTYGGANAQRLAVPNGAQPTNGAPSAPQQPANMAARSPQPATARSPQPAASRSPQPMAARSPQPAAAARSPQPQGAASPQPQAATSPAPQGAMSPQPAAARSPQPMGSPQPMASPQPQAVPNMNSPMMSPVPQTNAAGDTFIGAGVNMTASEMGGSVVNGASNTTGWVDMPTTDHNNDVTVERWEDLPATEQNNDVTIERWEDMPTATDMDAALMNDTGVVMSNDMHMLGDSVNITEMPMHGNMMETQSFGNVSTLPYTVTETIEQPFTNAPRGMNF